MIIEAWVPNSPEAFVVRLPFHGIFRQRVFSIFQVKHVLKPTFRSLEKLFSE
jgi:hypothetical protein